MRVQAGDRMGDMEFARRFGARPILVLTSDRQNTLKRPDFQTLENTTVCKNLTQAIDQILSRHKQ
jgi:histidinol phosphatase-like enzyme